VTSPNADYIPEILDPSTEVKLRADLRYGPDDATLWPQPYLENYPYLSVIPHKTQDPHRQKSVMWWLPKASDFEQSNTAMVKGIGSLTGTEMDSVKEQVRSLLKRVRDYRNGEGKNLKKEDGSMLIDSGLVTLVHTWVRLDGSPGTLEEKCMELSEVQRSYPRVEGNHGLLCMATPADTDQSRSTRRRCPRDIGRGWLYHQPAAYSPGVFCGWHTRLADERL